MSSLPKNDYESAFLDYESAFLINTKILAYKRLVKNNTPYREIAQVLLALSDLSGLDGCLPTFHANRHSDDLLFWEEVNREVLREWARYLDDLAEMAGQPQLACYLLGCA